jgi:endonuclease G
MKHGASCLSLVLLLATLSGCQTPSIHPTRTTPTAPSARTSPPVIMPAILPRPALTNAPDAQSVFAYAGLPAFKIPGRFTVLTNGAYVLGYDESAKVPRWVCYRLFRLGDVWTSVKGPPRPDFFTDLNTTARVKKSDYDRSGYDRGHMAPNAGIAIRYGIAAQRETFKMSNMAPQAPALNRHTWERLEATESEGYANFYTNVWVTAGAIVRGTDPMMGPGIRVPGEFYKIHVVLVQGRPQVHAFIYRNLPDDPGRLVSIREIEDKTGLDFFSTLPASVQDALETPVPAQPIYLPPRPAPGRNSGTRED